jgi:uncharacterized protein
MNNERTNTRRTFVGVLGALVAAAPSLTRAQGSTQTGAASMTPGFLVIYRPGPKWLPGKPLAEQPLREHGRYMLDLYRQGILRMAGGFGDDSGGAALLNVSDIEQARAHADKDPAVVAQTFVYELREWRLVPWDQIANRSRP